MDCGAQEVAANSLLLMRLERWEADGALGMDADGEMH